MFIFLGDMLVSLCFQPSQPPGIISGLRGDVPVRLHKFVFWGDKPVRLHKFVFRGDKPARLHKFVFWGDKSARLHEFVF